jgi:hypothetical protein
LLAAIPQQRCLCFGWRKIGFLMAAVNYFWVGGWLLLLNYQNMAAYHYICY